MLLIILGIGSIVAAVFGAYFTFTRNNEAAVVCWMMAYNLEVFSHPSPVLSRAFKRLSNTWAKQ